MAYYDSNAFVHPDIDQFNYLVKCQGEIKEIKAKWLEVLHQPKYAVQPPPGLNPVVYDRWDTAQCKADVEAGKTSLPRDYFVRMREIIDMKFAAKHKFYAKGVELSPGSRPMAPTNVLVNPEDGGIGEAISRAHELDLPVVSKDVVGQLNEAQRERLSEVDGVHQYATEPIGKVTLRNPTGQWPVGAGELGVKVPVQPGVERIYHLRSRHINIKLQRMTRGDAIIEIGTRLKDFYGLGTGVYRFSTEGVEYLRDCNQLGMTEDQVRNKIEPFLLRDKYGYHGGDVTLVGECSWKVDGIFCLLDARNGTAEFKFRNGEIWTGPCDIDITAAFEMVEDELYMLYTEYFKGNKISMEKKVQDYFRDRIEIIIDLVGSKKLNTVASCENLPRDGIVIWGSSRQTYFKDPNSVDLTKKMMRDFSRDPDVGMFVVDMDKCVEGRLYEYKVKDAFTIVPAKYDKEGIPEPRPVLSKILPNKPKNILHTMTDPTIASLKRYHERDAKEKSHAECPVCKFLTRW